MPKIDSPADADNAVKDLKNAFKAISDRVGTLDKTYASKFGEYQRLSQPLWEGHDVIKEERATLEASIASFEKMMEKCLTLRKQMDTVGKMARDHLKELKQITPQLKPLAASCAELGKINKGSSLLKDAEKGIGELSTGIERLSGVLETVAQECEGLAELPKLPK